ncbi:MAG: adenosylcobinamide-GDP ribazoletransferase [Spirochaetaceae bacterium]|jgi:adenosylcobinamide-GDP ribazoletransferase|nr:adenosylcobinamide-GDP ribazoletransferase [Spirochaetaceae bacterium]
MNARNRFLSVFSMVSRIPVRAAFDFDISRIDFWLPVMGVFPALLAGGIVFVMRMLFPADTLPAAVAALAAQYFCFNLFHLDGLMDSADAFLGTGSAEKRLAILKDSRIGVYGFFAGTFALLFKTALLAGLIPLAAAYPFALFSGPVSGRAAAALVPVIAPPQNETGLGALSKNNRAGRVFAGIFTGALVWFLLAWAGTFFAFKLGLCGAPPFLSGDFDARRFCMLSLLPFAAVLTAFPVARLYRKGIGGYTGDALGAAVEIGETIHLALVFVLARLLVPAAVP